MTFAPRSLAARVALTCACAVAISGAVVALVVVLLSDRLAQHDEDTHLRDAARTLAYELTEPDAEPTRVADDETRELAHTGIRVALFERGRFLAGDRALSIPSGACADLGTRRACAHQAGRFIAVAGRDSTPAREHRTATAFAALVAVALTTLAGALASLVIARMVVKPLFRLRAAVNATPEDDPSAADLGPNENVIEVDTLRASLESAFKRLGAALAQSRRFATDAAHELRTPITTILGELELAAESANEHSRGEILHARKVAQRLSTLIDRLLILARPDANLDDAAEVDLLDVVEDALDPLPVAARARVTIAGGSVRVRGDQALLVAMLTNALENALKFSTGLVRVELAQSDGGAHITVEDEGPGISTSERERVFAPFYRSRDSRSGGIPGHGIGLALIAHVVALHRGQVRFAERERGARLEINLHGR